MKEIDNKNLKSKKIEKIHRIIIEFQEENDNYFTMKVEGKEHTDEKYNAVVPDNELSKVAKACSRVALNCYSKLDELINSKII